ncbi:MAG: cobalamin adenosyltransferase [Candidatus Hydrogenedentota bacterium]
MKSQVTTKHGDSGDTTTLAGEKVSKSHAIVECTGCIDEARAWTALVRQRLTSANLEDAAHWQDFLLWLLHVYFVIGSACSDPANRRPTYHPRVLGQADIERLESEQQRLEDRVKLPRQFAASGANPVAAECDVLVTVVRRMERSVVRLRESVPDFEATAILIFVNRLSDTLFMLARYLDGGVHVPVDYRLLDTGME